MKDTSHSNNNQRETIRSFIGITLSPAAQEFLRAFRQQHNREPWSKQIRWTAESNIHITMRFLGDVTSEQLICLQNGLGQLLEGSPRFEVTMTTPRPFPSVKRARLLAALIHKNQSLQQMAEDIEKRVVEAGVPPEDRPFQGHITVGRFRKPVKGLESLLVNTDTLIMPIDRVILFKSDLKPTGAEYTEIARFDLTTTV